ncbi:bifunctional folylpolyglutamate synthase/dihydrofolate synthase [Aegicerativicinus sediminis]|uniref:bifunctional folylpolyglutamate synthase/dihydrofolate synthase n=1 Tax=Aegicerativicinus sediminis TaxID=2893202 RepID=UPI001E52EF7F|nr:folylpolyglutamate synthase/dihydrofolate synthase family protein [Aegicerativicinus sediminis]
MTYQQTVNWMFQQLPMYQRQGAMAYKADLTNTTNLCSHLGNPERYFKSVHVAGTNGKGSVSHMLASVFQVAGYKTGLYTSPHLKDFRERIKINGHLIEEDYVVDFVENNRNFFEFNQLSFFEMTVGLAFKYFSDNKVDIAVIETGLGGRLDSTNVIMPELSVITNIGLDHTVLLGDTIEKIAVEKAGIIKKGVPVVIGETQSETTPIFNSKARVEGSELYYADQLLMDHVYNTDLKGSYQLKNVTTATVALNVLKSKGYNLSKESIRSGLNNVVKNTGLLGRWQILGEEPLVVCDTAHNFEGLNYVVSQIKEQNYRQLRMVLGFVADKNLERVIGLLPKEAIYYLSQPQIPRALDVDELTQLFHEHGFNCLSFESVKKALYQAKLDSAGSDFIFVGGSTFVVAEVV